MEFTIENRKVIDLMPLLSLNNIERTPSSRMGASSIGEDCERKTWLAFHWAMKDDISGKSNLIFGIGSTLEDLMGELLERKTDTATIMSKSLTANGLDIKYTGKEQIKVEVSPHFVVMPDGIIFSGVPTAEDTIHVWENKTSNNRHFNDLKKNGVRAAQPKHYSQMQIEMYGASMFLGKRVERALYTSINKDSAEVYAERIDRDEETIKKLLEKAKRIRLSALLPEAVSNDPTWNTCKYCAYSHFCFLTHEVENINCRTCAHSYPDADGKWKCQLGKDISDTKTQTQPCDWHTFNPSLVPWPVVNECCTPYACAYELSNGEIILNGYGGETSEKLKQLSVPKPKNGWEVKF